MCREVRIKTVMHREVNLEQNPGFNLNQHDIIAPKSGHFCSRLYPAVEFNR